MIQIKSDLQTQHIQTQIQTLDNKTHIKSHTPNPKSNPNKNIKHPKQIIPTSNNHKPRSQNQKQS